MYKGQLICGKPFAIDFAADATNSGTTFVGYYWHTDSQQPNDVASRYVAQGTSKQIGSGETPENAKILEINVRPPTGGGGKLRVTQGENTFDDPPVVCETHWTFRVKASQ